MTYKYNPFWQQRIRETVRHALNVHPRLPCHAGAFSGLAGGVAGA